MMFRLDRYHKGVLLGCTIFLSALMFILVQPTRSTPLTPAIWTVNTLDDPGAPTCAMTCSLRAAVNAAAPDDLIVFDASIFSIPQTIILSAQIEISQPLTIDGVAGGRHHADSER
jgi:CSLREA domain-containing protein